MVLGLSLLKLPDGKPSDVLANTYNGTLCLLRIEAWHVSLRTLDKLRDGASRNNDALKETKYGELGCAIAFIAAASVNVGVVVGAIELAKFLR